MSLSADDRQNIWKEHSDSLSRIRTQLKDSPVGVKSRTPVRSPRGRVSGRRSHSPYGKYRQSTPPYLPRLDQTPEQDKHKLRGKRYEVVPPVNRRSNSRPDDDHDSWGEESDEDSGEEQGQYLPQPYPYPLQPYPMPPPAVVFGPPFPVYYPQQPHVGRNGKKPKKGAKQADVFKVETPTRSQAKQTGRYEDVNRSIPLKAGKPKKQNRVHFPPENGFYGYPPTFPTYPMYSMENLYAGNHPQRYKYIHPRDTPYTPTENDGLNVYRRFKDEPDRLVEYYFKDHPLFAENIVDWFINECLEDFIPDLLIDAINDLDRVADYPTPFHDIRDSIVSEVVANMLHGLVRESLGEMVNEYMLFKDTDQDPLESFLTRLVNDAVTEATTEVVKETVRDMAREYVEDKHVSVFFDDLFYDFMASAGPELVNDAIFDLLAEEFIDVEVIQPELDEEVPEVAKEVLSHYDTKVMRRELKEVSSHAGDKLMESIVLDYLLSLVARQGYVWTESDHANKHMDDMITHVLLEQLFGVTKSRRKTINCKPLKKLHEKVVSDVALDVLLQQLTATLDEDLLDVDEYERGVTEPASSSFSTPSKQYS